MKMEELLKKWKEKAEENRNYNGDTEEENALAEGVALGYEYCIEDVELFLEFGGK